MNFLKRKYWYKNSSSQDNLGRWEWIFMLISMENIEQYNRNPNVCGMTNIFVLAWEINGLSL